jgi:type I restriction enzyme, R subunit
VLDFANDAEDIRKAFLPYFEEASIVESTDPNLIHDLQNKLDVAGLYTDQDIDAVVDAEIRHLGNNALSGAVAPAKNRFLAAMKAAVAAGDGTRVSELDVFRKDVGTYVRLYDFLSQLVDFGDTTVEKHAIFLRILATQIRGTRVAPVIDLSDVTLAHIRQTNTGKHRLDLVHSDVVALPAAFGSAGSRPSHDPRLALMEEVIAKLNEVFAGEGFRPDQNESWVESLLLAMKTDTELVEQGLVNNPDQFLASPSLRDAVTIAVAETNDANSRMTELFDTKGYVESALIELLGRLLYHDLHERLQAPEKR